MSDKTEWGPGPWQDEPDKEVWIDPATDLDCMVHRNRLGGWCGYVGVPRTHPYYGHDYDDDDVDVDVHGGLTYGAPCQEDGPLCHVPAPGRPADVWWFGFDCGHLCDYLPGLMAAERALGHPAPPFDYIYRDLAYVRAETVELAAQLALAT